MPILSRQKIVLAINQHPTEFAAHDFAPLLQRELLKLGYDVEIERMDMAATYLGREIRQQWVKDKNVLAAEERKLVEDSLRSAQQGWLLGLLVKHPDAQVISLHNGSIEHALTFPGVRRMAVSRCWEGDSHMPPLPHAFHIRDSDFATPFASYGDARLPHRLHFLEIMVPYKDAPASFVKKYGDMYGDYLRRYASVKSARKVGIFSKSAARKIARYLHRQISTGFAIPSIHTLDDFLRLSLHPDYSSPALQHRFADELMQISGRQGAISESQRRRLLYRIRKFGKHPNKHMRDVSKRILELVHGFERN